MFSRFDPGHTAEYGAGRNQSLASSVLNRLTMARRRNYRIPHYSIPDQTGIASDHWPLEQQDTAPETRNHRERLDNTAAVRWTERRLGPRWGAGHWRLARKTYEKLQGMDPQQRLRWLSEHDL